MWRSICLVMAVLLAGCVAAEASGPGIPGGNGQQLAALPGASLQVYTYRPAGCEPRMLMLVFHGVERNAAAYREHARPLADKVCAIILAPEFDRGRFPRDLYQYGGLTAAVGSRTVDLVPALASWAEGVIGGAPLPLVLLGHSAGSQFLDRVAAFVPTGAVRIVVANPSTWVWPSDGVAPPFGFGGVDVGGEALRRYLALPLVALLGTADLLTKNLDMSPGAMAQGPNRYQRGLGAFHAAEAAARAHGWAFNWRLLEVAGVGHSAKEMFGSAQALEALAR